MIILDRTIALAKFYIDSNLEKLLKNSGWTLFGNAFVLSLSLIRNVIVTRSIGLEGWGILTVVTATVAVINDLIDFRVWETVVKYMTADLAENKPRRAAATVLYSFGIDSFAGLLAFLVIVIFASWLNLFIVKSDNGEFILRLFALSLLFSTLDPSATAILQVVNRFDLISYTRIFTSVVLIIFTVILLSIDSTVENAIIAIIIGNFISSALILFYCLREANKALFRDWWKVNIRVELSGRIKEMTSYTIQTNFLGTIKMIATRFDIIIIGAIAGSSQAGLYRLASNLASLLVQITDPLYSAIFPDLSRIWAEKDTRAFTTLIRKASTLVSMIIIPVASMLFFSAPYIIGLLYGEEFLPAATPFRILIVGFVIATILFWTHPAILSMNMISVQTRLAVIVIFLQMVIIVLLTPVIGASAGAIGLSFAYIAVNIPLAIIVWRRLHKLTAIVDLSKIK